VRNRAGFSLVETLVALVLFQFAMLALTAGAAVAARDLAAARRIAVAHEMARNRVEQLAAVACPTPGTGTSETNGFIEQWRVEGGERSRAITDSVAFPRPNGKVGMSAARATVLCAL